MRDELRRRLIETRAHDPGAIAAAAASRPRRPLLGESGRLMIIAADHTARGILGVGRDPMAMENRFDLLDRVMVALSRPGVDGVLGTADIIEDLLLLGALDKKIAVGSMNRGGLQGAAFEMDDRFTCYSAASIVAANLDAGKMLLRVDPDDPATAPTLEACSNAVNELAEAHLPVMILGGDPSVDQDAMFDSWKQALALPTVRGLVVGRSLLYPSVGDVASAVDTAVSLL
jgi:hypothetical protein